MAEKILVETKLVNEELVGSSIVTNIIDLNELDFKNPKESPIKTAVIKGPKGDDPYNLMKYINDFYAAGYKPENEQDIIEIIAAKAFEMTSIGRESQLYKRAQTMNFERQEREIYQKKGSDWERVSYRGALGHLPTKIVVKNITSPMKISLNGQEYTEINEEDKTLTIELPDGFTKGFDNEMYTYGLDGKKRSGSDRIDYIKTPKSEQIVSPKGLENKEWLFDTYTITYADRFESLTESYIVGVNEEGKAVYSKHQTLGGYVSFPNATKIALANDKRTVGGSYQNFAANTSLISLNFADDMKKPFVLDIPNAKLSDKDGQSIVAIYENGISSDSPSKIKSKFRIICKRGTGEKTAEYLTKLGLTKHETTNEAELEVEDWYNESLWEKPIEEYFKEEA